LKQVRDEIPFLFVVKCVGELSEQQLVEVLPDAGGFLPILRKGRTSSPKDGPAQHFGRVPFGFHHGRITINAMCVQRPPD
jgi:hypothetical protein